MVEISLTRTKVVHKNVRQGCNKIRRYSCFNKIGFQTKSTSKKKEGFWGHNSFNEKK